MSEGQRNVLKAAREKLCELIDDPANPNRLNPMSPEYKEVTDLIAQIESMLGY